jgi:wyosine [tRNA(Phe)-imidazoG37] synthetase (radical SAM superfamily)
MSLLQMQEGILYGPVKSRRYGRSLGINLMPAKDKLCSFNCVYCHYGPTRRCTIHADKFAADLPQADDVICAVEQAMKSDTVFDLITFSGNGEPTLHPDFPELADVVVDLRNRYRPQVKVALLSNSSGLIFEGVRRVLGRLDLPVMKLDVGSARVFRAINRPVRDVTFEEITYLLSDAGDIILQTVLVDGSPTNITPLDLHAYFEQLIRIRPVEVHIYSIDRPVADSNIRLVPPDRLHQIATQAKTETGIEVKVFHV